MDEPRQNWLQRNWKWFVPAGCLFALVALAGMIFALVYFVFATMKSSGAYAEAVDRARNDCQVQAVLGPPVEPGWFMSGSINVTGPTGRAEIAIPIRGSARAGRIYANADKSANRWIFELLEVEVDGEDSRIDLLEPGRPRCE